MNQLPEVGLFLRNEPCELPRGWDRLYRLIAAAYVTAWNAAAARCTTTEDVRALCRFGASVYARVLRDRELEMLSCAWTSDDWSDEVRRGQRLFLGGRAPGAAAFAAAIAQRQPINAS